MNVPNPIDFRVVHDAENADRHWSPNTEKFARCDALLCALDQGWQVTGVIFRQDFWYSGARRVPVYHFELRRDEEIVKMPVLYTPYLTRVIDDLNVQVVLYNTRKHSERELW